MPKIDLRELTPDFDDEVETFEKIPEYRVENDHEVTRRQARMNKLRQRGYDQYGNF